jgi:uncharacterized membrane protein YfcA
MTASLWISLLGSLVGLVLALTGAGGGALAVPLLVFGAGLSLQQAAPMSLVAVGLAAALGAGLGLRDGIVRYRAAGVIGAAGMAAAPFGVGAAQGLAQAPLLIAFAGFMLLTAWRMARPSVPQRAEQRAVCFRAPGDRRLTWSPACALVLSSVGAVSGLLSGLLGIGGGFVIVPALERRTNLDIASIQATSLAVIALVAVSGLAAAAWHGGVSPATAAPFALGAVAGLLTGRRVSRHLPAQRLRQAFAATAVGVAGLVLWRAAHAGA